jgi:hypothetical protein
MGRNWKKAAKQDYTMVSLKIYPAAGAILTNIIETKTCH